MYSVGITQPQAKQLTMGLFRFLEAQFILVIFEFQFEIAQQFYIMLRISNANCSPEQIQTMLSRYGSILINIVRGQVLAKFEDEDTAKRALSDLNGLVINKKKWIVRPYRGGYVSDGEDEDAVQQMDVEPQLEKHPAEGAFINTKVKEVEGQTQKLLEKKLGELKAGYKAITEDMVRENIDQQEQARRIALYNEKLTKQTEKLLTSTHKELSRFVSKMNAFETRIIDLEKQKPKQSSLLRPDIKYLQVRNPYYETASGSIRRLMPISATHFICSFELPQCVKLYSVNDFTILNSIPLKQRAVSLSLFTSCDRNYALMGDPSGRIGAIKLNPFEKLFDECQFHEKYVTEIKWHSQNKFVSSSIDGVILCWKVDEEERMPGDYSIEMTKTDEHFGKGRIASMDILNQNELVLGLTDSKVAIQPLLKSQSQTSAVQESSVLKVLRDTDKSFWACVNTKVKLIDSRSLSDAVVFENIGTGVRALTKVSDNVMCFGGMKRIGLADRRAPRTLLWKNDEEHSAEVRDIISMGNFVFSGGIDGNVIRWQTM